MGAAAQAKGTAYVEPAGEAERAMATKSEALVPWVQDIAWYKVMRLPQEGKYVPKTLLREGNALRHCCQASTMCN